MKKLLTNYCFYCILLCSLFTLNVTAQSILNETCDDCCSISNITAQGITCDGENLNIEMIQAEVSGGSGIYGFFVESFIIEEPLETETTNGTITFEDISIPLNQLVSPDLDIMVSAETVENWDDHEPEVEVASFNIIVFDVSSIVSQEQPTENTISVELSEEMNSDLPSPDFPGCVGANTFSMPMCGCGIEIVEQEPFVDCNNGSVFVDVEFSTNATGTYTLMDGNTIIGSRTIFSCELEQNGATFSNLEQNGATVANWDIDGHSTATPLEPGGPMVNSIFSFSIGGTIVGPVTAGTRTLRLVNAEDEDCMTTIEVGVPDCSCSITEVEGTAECTDNSESASVLSDVVLDLAFTNDQADGQVILASNISSTPFVTLTFEGEGASSFAAYYIDENGFPIFFGSTDNYGGVFSDNLPISSTTVTLASSSTTQTISGQLPSSISGNVTFYIVEEEISILVAGVNPCEIFGVPFGDSDVPPGDFDILSEGPSVTLEPPTGAEILAEILAFSACEAMIIVAVPNCEDEDMDGILNEDDDCNDLLDTDGDNVPDCSDGCPTDALKIAPGTCGCNVSDVDSDGDGTSDCRDICDDRIDSDGDGTSDCRDECPNDPSKVIEDACGCGEPDQTDSDGDGIIDCMDSCPFDLNQYVDGTLECGRTIASDTRLGDRIIGNYGECSNGNFEGRELFYRLTLHDAGSVNVRFKEVGSGTRELQLFVFDTLCFIDNCIGTIIGNPGTEESLLLEDLEAGDYFFAVDSRGFFDRADFELTVDCGVGGATGSVVTCNEDALLSEDFEGLAVGSDIVLAGSNFELFGESSTSANVVATEGETPNNALYFNRSVAASDVNFVVGNQQSGIGRVAWNMFVEPNRGATINIYGHESTFSFAAHYEITPDDEDLQGKWMAVEAFIDLDNNRYTLFVDNRAVVVTGDYLPGLGRVNFYAFWNNAFLIDNLCYSVVGSVPAANRTARIESALLTNNIKPTAANTTETVTDANYETNVTATTSATFVNDLTVYPNPTKGLLNVNLSLEKEMSMTLELLDPMGRVVRTINTAKTTLVNEQLSVSDLANGLYILRAYNKDVVLTKRIIKQ